MKKKLIPAKNQDHNLNYLTNFFTKILTDKKKFGFSLPELTIALSILLLSVIVLVSLATSYLSILNSYKKRFLALNITQEGIELAIALRNKQIENLNAGNWLGIATSGYYCLEFNTSSQEIIVTPTTSSGYCEVYPGYQRKITYSDFQDQSKSDLKAATSVKVVSETIFGNDSVSLSVILTKWHPIFFP